MEEQLAHLQMRNDEIWELLQDPTLPPLDRQMLDEEMLRNTVQIVILEQPPFEEDDDEDRTLTCESSESIGADEYDREGLIANDDFDLGGEI
jgi:hypothetical protein